MGIELRGEGTGTRGGWLPWRERLLLRMVADSVFGCWTLTGRSHSCGYSVMRIDGELEYLHRLVYVMAWGEIPEGTEVDHLCRNPPCFNPLHLEAVTHRENLARAPGPVAAAMRTKRCHRGHDDWYYRTRNDRGGITERHCRTCARAATERHNARKAG